MSENKNMKVQEKSSDVAAFSIINMAIRNLHYILISGLAVAILVFLIVTIFVSPTYEVRTSFYVYNTSASESGSVNSSDMQAAKNLATTYAKILGSNAVVDTVINDLDDINGNERTALRNNIRVNGVNDTQVIEVKVLPTAAICHIRLRIPFRELRLKRLFVLQRLVISRFLISPKCRIRNPHRERFMIQCSVFLPE